MYGVSSASMQRKKSGKLSKNYKVGMQFKKPKTSSSAKSKKATRRPRV